MRWTPAGAAAPDPKMRPPDDGLFTGLGGLSKENDLKQRNRKAVGKEGASNRARYNPTGRALTALVAGKWYSIHSLFTGPQPGE